MQILQTEKFKKGIHHFIAYGDLDYLIRQFSFKITYFKISGHERNKLKRNLNLTKFELNCKINYACYKTINKMLMESSSVSKQSCMFSKVSKF